MDKIKGGRPAYAPKAQDAEIVKVLAAHQEKKAWNSGVIRRAQQATRKR